MATPIADTKGVVTTRFTLADIPDFPYEVYSTQRSVYEECERWFRGYALDDQVNETGSPTELYPLKINPIISTVLKHAYILFGEVTNDGRPLVQSTLVPENDTDEAKKIAQEAEDALNHVWWENNGRSLMFENGILSQIYGGCIFKATYVPWEWDKYGGWRKIPIRIERVHPKSFIGRPNAGDMYRLREAWVVSDMPLEEARKWGYSGYDDTPTFAEYWSDGEHRSYINEDEVSFPLAIPDQRNPFNGINFFNLVPLVYIPHVRIGGFHGMNAFDHLKGIIRELNLRFADYGDAVNDDSHVPLAMVNVNGSPQYKRIGEGLKVIDLGSSANITGGESDPNIFEVHKSRSSASMQNLVDELVDQYRRDSFVPAVAEGEDEGSQRSALTLATRFWPLTSHAGIERVFFSNGLDVFNTYLLRMMATKGIDGIGPEHTKMRMKQSWAPMLPRDREAEVQEWTSRASANITSPEHLMTLTRDIDDIAAEREKILKWLKDVASIEAEANAKAAQMYPAPSPFGGGAKTGEEKRGRPPEKPEKTPTQKVGGGGGE